MNHYFIVVHPNSIINMFADDVLLYHIISRRPGDYLDAQHSITTIEHWSSGNKLQLSVNAKKLYMTITIETTTSHHSLTLKNNNLEYATNTFKLVSFSLLTCHGHPTSHLFVSELGTSLVCMTEIYPNKNGIIFIAHRFLSAVPKSLKFVHVSRFYTVTLSH